MTEDKQMSEDFSSSNFISFMNKWSRHLLIVAIISVALSVFFSSPLFITPKFKATVIMFPASSNAVSKALLAENPSAKSDILEFGEEEQAEQLLQILYSNEIRSRIIRKYNLMQHYGIDTSAKYKMTRLHNEYKDNISFKRNEFMAVEVNVLDKDPQIASGIANDIASLVDTVKNNMQKERARYGLKIVKNQCEKLQNEILKKEDSLKVLMNLGIFDYETQSEMLHRQYAVEVARNNQKGIKALDEQLGILAKYGGAYVSVRDALVLLGKQFSSLKAKYEEAKVDAEQSIPQKFVVDYAFRPEKKTYPVRWLIVVFSTVSALLLATLIIIVQDNLKKN
jgi:hypothetical protein